MSGRRPSPTRVPSRRPIDGILLLDKPGGLSSNQAMTRVRTLYRARKSGHGGSLDPFATGMLPVMFGEATKFSAALLEAAKSYRARCRLGVATATGDPEGEVTAVLPVPDLEQAHIERQLAAFVGEIEQVPPMYSALKHRGRRLYQLAREGREVERRPRRVRIHELDLLAAEGEFLDLRISCSKGTYVRTLVEDIARALGTVAHTVALRRTRVGPFAAAQMHPLPALEALTEHAALERLLLPVDAALGELPVRALDRATASMLRHGQPVAVSGDPGTVRLYEERGAFLGVGRLGEDGVLRPLRLIANDAASRR